MNNTSDCFQALLPAYLNYLDLQPATCAPAPPYAAVFITPDVAENLVFVFADGDPDAIKTVMLSENIGIEPREDSPSRASGAGSFVWRGLTLRVLKNNLLLYYNHAHLHLLTVCSLNMTCTRGVP
jgi:hypothetical protein